MNTWAKRGSMSHAKYGLMNWGKKRNQIANHAAAAAPRRPQPIRDRRAVSIPTLPRPTEPRARRTAYAGGVGRSLGGSWHRGPRAGRSPSTEEEHGVPKPGAIGEHMRDA